MSKLLMILLIMPVGFVATTIRNDRLGDGRGRLRVIEVTRPRAADVWLVRSRHLIEWNSYATNQDVDLSFSVDEGQNWQIIAQNQPNTGTYEWIVPNTVDSHQCQVLVTLSDSSVKVRTYPSGLFTIAVVEEGLDRNSLWPVLGGSQYHTGLSFLTGPKLPSIEWAWETPGAVYSSATVGEDGTIYLACTDGKLYAVDAEGQAVWTYDTQSPLTSSPSIGPDGMLVVGADNGTLFAIDDAGQLRWRITLDGPIHAAPCIPARGDIYVGTLRGTLYALGLDGSEYWRWTKTRTSHAFPDTFMASASTGLDGRVYVGTLYDPALYALDPDTGQIEWQCQFPGGQGIYAAPVVAGHGTIYQVLLGDDHIYAIEPNDGSILWQLSLAEGEESLSGQASAGWTEPVLGPDGTIYTCLDDPLLHAIAPEGFLLWSLALGDAGGFTLTADQSGDVYAAGSDGHVYTVSAQGELSTVEIGKAVSYPVIGPDNRLMVTSPEEHRASAPAPSLWVLSQGNE